MTMRNYNRFIPGEEIGEVEQWHFGAVGVSGVLLGTKPALASDEKSVATADVKNQEGFAEGFIQGHAQAVLETHKQISDYIENEGREQAQNFGQLMASAKAQLANADQVLAHGVLALACEIARQILQQEITVNVEAVKPVIAQGLAFMLDEGKSAKIRLSPFDFDELKESLLADYEPIALSLVADPSISSGGCLIESNDTIVDGTIEKRWSRTIASLGLHSVWWRVDEA
jgi:flagellar assembly protein FliH